MLKVLPSVRPRSLFIAAAVTNAAEQLALGDTTITSGNDSTHMKGSKHYEDKALDFRTHHLQEGDRTALIREAGRRLGNDFQLILEDVGKANEHLHVEYDPRLPGNTRKV